jgi:hypothetical protein
MTSIQGTMNINNFPRFFSRVEQQDIRNELLAKLKPVVPKHLGFVDNNVENVVYMMLNVNKPKGRVIQALFLQFSEL